MALSDYLTDDEWDACFCMFMIVRSNGETGISLGEVMHLVIDELLQAGYVFKGLDSKGKKLKQITSHNAEKMVKGFFTGSISKEEYLKWIKNGYEFLAKNCPDLVRDEDDTNNKTD